MNPFEESIPEEREEKQTQLIALLRQAYRQEQTLPDSEQQEAVLRVGARLARRKERPPTLAGRTLEGMRLYKDNKGNTLDHLFPKLFSGSSLAVLIRFFLGQAC